MMTCPQCGKKMKVGGTCSNCGYVDKKGAPSKKAPAKKAPVKKAPAKKGVNPFAKKPY